MKKTGDICRVDALGRIVIPVRLRRSFDLGPGDPLEVLASEDEIVLKKYIPKCVFCMSEENLTPFKSKYICAACTEELGK